ncbi:MAG: TadE family protein [Cyanobacteriota bacterium]
MKKINKGQSLLEFSLVAPVLVMILVVISELGYAFVVRHTIIDSIKQTVQSSHYMVGKYTTTADLLAAMEKDLKSYIQNHNLPAATKLGFAVGSSNDYGTAVLVTYSYNPAFRLIGITPEEVTIQSAQILPPSLLKVNSPTITSTPSL